MVLTILRLQLAVLAAAAALGCSQTKASRNAILVRM